MGMNVLIAGDPKEKRQGTVRACGQDRTLERFPEAER